jgi:DNA (cytosine-5)-methyltransferase 1
MNILNLYAGIGGNRKLWPSEHKVTAVELDRPTAEVYRDLYPDDKVIVTDAHEYLLKHYKEYDFIWSSPPCPTHSRARFGFGVCGHGYDYVYPDMSLYQEVILLRFVFKGRWCIENVIPYYGYLIEPSQILGRHAYWANFYIKYVKVTANNAIAGNTKPPGKLSNFKITGERDYLEKLHGLDLSSYSGIDIRKALRNAVEPEIGLHILDCAEDKVEVEQATLF